MLDILHFDNGDPAYAVVYGMFAFCESCPAEDIAQRVKKGLVAVYAQPLAEVGLASASGVDCQICINTEL